MKVSKNTATDNPTHILVGFGMWPCALWIPKHLNQMIKFHCEIFSEKSTFLFFFSTSPSDRHSDAVHSLHLSIERSCVRNWSSQRRRKRNRELSKEFLGRGSQQCRTLTGHRQLSFHRSPLETYFHTFLVILNKSLRFP